MISMPEIMKQEIMCALGCTEPSAVALAVAIARETLGEKPECVELFVSGNILKNAMSVGIPGTELKGIEIAAALGSVVGKSEYFLEVLRDVTTEDIAEAQRIIAEGGIKIELKKECQDRLYIEARCVKGTEFAVAVIQGAHTNISLVCRNGEMIRQQSPKTLKESAEEGKYDLKLHSIWEYVNGADVSEFCFLSEVIEVNSSIAEEGLQKDYGMGVGKHLYDRAIKTDKMDFQTYVVSYTAAAADARMAGCLMPVMATTGSGNHGLTASLPVVAAAKWLECDDEKLYRALALSELVTIHVKEHIGKLSALCGCAIAASIGSACALVYLQGGTYIQMEYAVKNMIADISGLVCDGAKAGCALKIATSVAGAVQCASLALDGVQVPDHDGIVWTDVEQTIRNLGNLGNKGMQVADKVILEMMLDGQNEKSEGNMKNLQISIENWVDQQMPNVIEDLKRVCRIRSVAEPEGTECPPFGQGCIDVLQEMLLMGKEEGFEIYNYENYVGRITYPGQTKDNIGIWAHLDVVEERENWTYAPYEPTVKDGYLIARGCQDNKSSAIVGFYALKYFKEHGIVPNHTMELYLGTCEEKGMYDIDYFLEHYQAPSLSLVPDSGFPVCCGERGSYNGELRQNKSCSEDILGIDCHCDLYTVPDHVVLTVRATDAMKEKCRTALENVSEGDIRVEYSEDGAEIQIIARGVSTQSMNPFHGKSALTGLAEFICDNDILEFSEKSVFAFLKEINTDFNGKALNVYCEDSLSGPVVLVATRMRLVEQHLIIDFVSKYPVTCNDFPFEENVRAVAGARGFTLTVTRFSKANWFDPERPEVKAFTRVSNQVLGRNDKPFVMSGGTYARKLPNAMACGTGMPLPPLPKELFLPGHGDFHQPDEAIALERIRKGLVIYIMGLLEIDK